MTRTTDRLAALQAENKRWDEQAAVLFGHQKRGIELEREGKPEEAAEAYEAAAAFGRAADKMTVNQYFYSIKRLCIIYRKLRMYDSEIATIQTALGEYLNVKDRERLTARLSKARELQAKHQGGRTQK